MKTSSFLNRGLVQRSLGIWLGLGLLASASARVLDNFNGAVRTGWQDVIIQGLGSVTQTNGQLVIDVPGVNQPLFVATANTTETFAVRTNHTVILQADLISGNDPSAVGVLAWLPTGNDISKLQGYALAVSSDRIVVSKGLNEYFWDGGPPSQSTNITLVLSLTGQGANVVIETKILDRASNAILFDQTFTDTPSADVLARGTDTPPTPWTGPGSFVLMNYADQPSSGALPVYEVIFDNAQVFEMDNVVIDNFQGPTHTGWQDLIIQGLGQITQTNGTLVIDVPGVNQQLFAASIRLLPPLTVRDGDRVDLRVDLVSGNDPSSVAVLAWLPTGNDLTKLQAYGFAVSSDRIVITKGLNEYFYDGNAPTSSANITLDLALTGSGSNVIIEPKILDKSNGNSNIFDQIFVDTPGPDVMAKGVDNPPAPYSGSGNFVLMNFADQPSSGALPVYEVVFANAQASIPSSQAHNPPVISNLQPPAYTNFLAGPVQISFQVADSLPLVASNLLVTLNGQPITTTNGLSLSGPPTNLTVRVSGLATNANYAAAFQVIDSAGAIATNVLYFDTFLTNDLQIEVEDYNFNGGQFIDNPVPAVEGTGPLTTSYMDQMGIKGVDYQDSRTDFRYSIYRPQDTTRMQHTLDNIRPKFLAAGGPALNVFDYDVGGILVGQWFNYTRTFPAGAYEVYLRESLFNGDQAQASLALVTSDPTQTNQTTQVLGTFLAYSSGVQYRNVPLTDAFGKKIIVALQGVQTLRLNELSSDPSGGNIYQNYLVFVPVAQAGVQRATVSAVTPLDGSVVQTVTPVLSATIQNRDTAVKTNSIVLMLNGTQVTPTLTANTNGVTVSYNISPLPPSGANNTAQIVYSDNLNVLQTNQWSFVITYNSVDPANRAAGVGKDPGFYVRTVQAPQGSGLDNSLARAEAQLAPGSTIPVFSDTNGVASVVNFNIADGTTMDFGPMAPVPGLDIADNGSDDFAVDLQAYLSLPAGVQRFGVVSDDGYEVIAGTTLTDLSPKLGFHNGGPANETFDFVVPQAGLYPFRMIWYNRGGAAYAEWFSVDLVSGAKTLINDTNSPNSIRAYHTLTAPTLQVQSTPRLGAPWQTEGSAIVQGTTATIALPAGNRFYRLTTTAGSPRIQSVRVSGSNLVLTFSLSN